MSVHILVGDCREVLPTLPDRSVHCCVTSPPYFGLRDYGTADWSGGDAGCDHLMPPGGGVNASGMSNYHGETFAATVDRVEKRRQQYRDTCGKCGAVRLDRQIGLEQSLDEYITTLVDVFREVRRCLRDDGTLWLVLGDSYNSTPPGKNPGGFQGAAMQANEVYNSAYPRQNGKGSYRDGLKPKDLMLVPARVALALQADGWWLRSDIIWAKKAPMPESVTDRPTSAHEHVFLLTKRRRYFWDAEAVREDAQGDGRPRGPGRIARPGIDVNGGNQGRGTIDHDIAAGRSLRNVWHLGPEPYAAAHFATFVTEIPRRAILAGTSEKGCCPACGAPWGRVVARYAEPKDIERKRNVGGRTDGYTITKASGGLPDVETTTLGWQPSCACAETRCTDCGFVLELAHEKEKASTNQDVSDMWEAVPSVEAGEFVLQSGMLQAITEEARRPDMRTMREAVPAAIEPLPVLRQVLLDQMDSQSTPEQPGVVPNQQGVHSPVSPGSSPSDQGRLRDGAPLRDGADDRPSAPADGDRPPYQWSEGRQQAGESRTDPLDQRSRQAQETDLHSDVPPLRRVIPSEGECPRCGGRLEQAPLNPQPATVLDIFAGAGTTGLVADRLGRDAILIELNPQYADLARQRITNDGPLFAQVEVGP